MSELDAAVRLRPSWAALVMMALIMALVIAGMIWASVTEVEELTRGEGRVVPTQDIQIVQSLEGGILQELSVSEGERVEKGQVLLRISDVQFASEERGTEAKLAGLRVKKARLEAEIEGRPLELPMDLADFVPDIVASEQALYQSRQRELEDAFRILDERISKAEAGIAETKARISQLYNSRKLLQEELEITRDMVAKRAKPKLEQIRLERELGDMNGEINAQSQKKKGLESELQVAQTEKSSQGNKFRSQSLRELNEVETELAGLREDIKSISDRVARTELRAPVAGIVNSIAVTTLGGVVESAQQLVEIVPMDDALKIIARVKPDEIAFLHPGQPVNVKVTAYDPQQYGALKGKLTRIAANSVTTQEGGVFFEVEVRTDKNYLGTEEKPLRITPGMVANVEIITGKRTILTYLLKPLYRAQARALRER